MQGGIAGLTKFFRTKFSDCWVTVSPPTDPSEAAPYQVDNLCIDMNQVLHTGLRLALSGNTKHFMSKVFKDLDNILRLAQPSKSLVLAFDGPAPFAKIQTQRSRRSSSPENSIITPGTTFMNKMESIMVCYVMQRLRRKEFRNLSVFISGPSCPGEGELKIVEWINSHMLPPQPGNLMTSNSDGAINCDKSGRNFTSKTRGSDWCEESLVICGSDSDILLQSLALSHVNPEKTLVMQSSRGTANIPNIHGLNKIGKSNKLSGGAAPSSFCNVSQIIKNLRVYTGIEVSHERANQMGERVMNLTVPESFNLDMVVLFVLQGNDYLPKMRGATIARTAGAYGRALRRLPPSERHLLDLENNTFNFPALWTLMDELLNPCVSGQLLHDNDIYDHDENFRISGPNLSSALVPLPVPLTTAMQTLHTYLQRRKMEECEWEDFHSVCTSNSSLSKKYTNSVENSSDKYKNKVENQLGQLMWGTRICINGKEFSCAPIHNNKKQARQQVATEALQELAPELLQEMKVKQHQAREKLQAMRHRVELELLTLQQQELSTMSTTNFSRSCDSSTSYDTNINKRNKFKQRQQQNYTEFLDLDLDLDEDALYVTETEYLSYVRGSDTKAYLNGIMWVVQMYVDGVCPDLSFTFLDRPPASALTIKYYIEKEFERSRARHNATKQVPSYLNSEKMIVLNDILPVSDESNKNDKINYQDAAVANLREQICIPYSRTRPLSSSAACVCVIPYCEEAAKHVPLELHSIWKRMQNGVQKSNNLDDHEISSKFTSYAELILLLKKAFNEEKLVCVDKLKIDGLNQGLRAPEQVTCSAKESVWTVISPTHFRSNRTSTKQKNIMSNSRIRPQKTYKPHAYLTLADVAQTLNDTFHIPPKMPLGHKLVMTSQHIHSRKNRLRLYLRRNKIKKVKREKDDSPNLKIQHTNSNRNSI